MKITKLADMDIEDREKDVLAKAFKGVNIAEAAVILNVGYTRAWQKLAIYVAKGWLSKRKTLGKKPIYILNRERLSL